MSARITFSVLTLLFLIGTTANAAPGISYTQRGTTKGLFTDNPDWSAGIQLGNHGATGFCVQKYGVYEGAVSIAAGLAYGTITFSVDYQVMLNAGFQRVRITDAETYNSYRGQIQPYAGGGIQLADGFSLRIPAGVQYTMLKDPFTFFGGIAVLYGQFLDKTDGASVELWYNLGARILL